MTFDDNGNSFAHYGVLGMKWGVRRYQNKDGSLTSAGKKSTKKQRSKMTDAEISARIRRLEKETKLKDLEKKNQDDGKAYANEILKDIGKRVITTAATGAILYGGKVLIDKNSFNIHDLGNAVFRGGDKKK